MNTSDIVIAIDAKIAQLQKAKAILTGTDTTVKRKPGRPVGASTLSKAVSFNPAEFAAKSEKRRSLSVEARTKIAAAQKARWAKSKRAAKKAISKAASAPLKKAPDKFVPAPAKKAITTKPVAQKTTKVKKAVAVKKPAASKTEKVTTPAS